MSKETGVNFDYTIIWENGVASREEDEITPFSDPIVYICQFAKHITTYVDYFQDIYISKNLNHFRKMPVFPMHMLSFVRPMIATEITSKKLLSQEFAAFADGAEEEETDGTLEAGDITFPLMSESPSVSEKGVSAEKAKKICQNGNATKATRGFNDLKTSARNDKNSTSGQNDRNLTVVGITVQSFEF